MSSLIVVTITGILGFLFPRFLGWVFLAISPIFIDLGNLIILNDPIFPLRFQQLVFAISLGAALSKLSPKNIVATISKSRAIFVFILFIGAEIIYGLADYHETFLIVVTHYYPAYFAAIILPFIVLKSTKDLYFLVSIFSYLCIFIVVLIVVELSFGFNIAHYLCSINMENCNLNSQHWMDTSRYKSNTWYFSGQFFGRYAGFTGDPNKTAIVLAMLLVFLYANLYGQELKNQNLLRKIMYSVILGFGFVILLMSQVRAPIFAFLLILIALSFSRRNILKFNLFSILIFLPLISLPSEFLSYIAMFTENRLSEVGIIDSERARSYSLAIQIFFNSFGLGVGGNIHSLYVNYLDYRDVSPYVSYLAVGGLVLGSLYFVFLYYIIMDLMRFMSGADQKLKLVILLFLASLSLGMITQVFNDNSMIFYYLLMYSSCLAVVSRNLNYNR